MTGPRGDHALRAAIERSLALMLDTSAVLLGAMRENLTPSTPPQSLRACLEAARAHLRLTDRVDRWPVRSPDDDPPEAVRADAERRDLTRALRALAEPLAADLTRRLRTPRARRGARLARIAQARRPVAH